MAKSMKTIDNGYAIIKNKFIIGCKNLIVGCKNLIIYCKNLEKPGYRAYKRIENTMLELTSSQRARAAIREFKTVTDSLAIRGFYRPSGKFGKALENCLKELSPEIYGTMNDTRVIELKGLEYVIDRLPQGIEQSTKIILTDEDQFEDTSFVEIEPLKRRRSSYRINNNELCFIISRGISEIYDIITHMTFLNIEALKIFRKMHDDYGNVRSEWLKLEKLIHQNSKLSGAKLSGAKLSGTKLSGTELSGTELNDIELRGAELDSALWNMSIILGRPYHETRESYEYLEKNRMENKSNNGLFSLIYHLAKRIEKDHNSREDALVIYFTPSLMNIIGHQKYGKLWASRIDRELIALNLHQRPLHIISANLHSVVNMIYGYAAMEAEKQESGSQYIPDRDIYDFFSSLKDKKNHVIKFAQTRGLYLLPDDSGANIDCQLIDMAQLDNMPLHPDLDLNFNLNFDAKTASSAEKPVILLMDYAFGAQAFEIMEQLLKPFVENGEKKALQSGSISIMGKAGILPGEKGDIMLATAHVCEGTSDNYLFDNDLTPEDFGSAANVYVGPMATVPGTSLQNKDVLEMFKSDWKAVGLEMEGGHFHKAINAAIIKGNIPADTRTRYAYYASDNPLMTGNTLAAGAMGQEGIKPTYMITKVILEKIISSHAGTAHTK